MKYIIFLLILSATAAAQELVRSEYSYRRYTVSEGLPDMICVSVYQDSRGFMWVGTMSGFARFDGRSFREFDSRGLSVVGFAEDGGSGNVVGLGLASSFRVDGKDSVSVLRMIHASQGARLRVSSKGLPPAYGIYSIDGSCAVYAVNDTGMVKVWEHETLNLLSDEGGVFWDRPNRRFFIAAGKDGLYVVSESGEVDRHPEATNIRSIIPYRNTVWAAGYDGIYEYAGGKMKKRLDHDFFNGESQDIQMVEDSEHNLLIRNISQLYRYADGQLELAVDKVNSLRDVTVDSEGNIWLAAANGLFNYYKLKFRNHYLQPEGSASQSLVADGSGRLWIPYIDGRLARMENGRATEVKYQPSPYGYSFFHTGSTASGNMLYFSGGGGLLRYDSRRNSFDWAAGLPMMMIDNISMLPNGDLAISNTGVLVVYNPAEGVRRIYEMAELRQYVITSFVDRDGNILVGGVAGLTVIKGDSIRYLTDERLEKCSNIMYDRDGKLWMSCRNRLASLEGDSLTVEHSFPGELNNLYITRSGLMIAATKDELYISREPGKLDFLRYDGNSGYLDAFGILGARVAEDLEGTVYISTIEKVVSFHPDRLLGAMNPPRLYIQSLASSVNNIQWEAFESDRAQDYRHNSVRFSYLALSNSAAENICYRYRLIGFQNEWSEPTKSREATFNNLPPGEYTFEIYSDAGADDSRSETRAVAFTIRPAFWQTGWFAASAVIALVSLAFLTSLTILRRRNRALVEKLRAEKELNELRISAIRLKAIPHFNANVLSAIEYYIANRTKEEAMRILGVYSDFTFKTLSEVDKAARPLSEELAYVRMYLELEKIRFVDKFDFDIEVDPNVNRNAQLPNMILHTYCENAVKHGLMPLKSGGRLSIHVSQLHSSVLVKVEDNGVGREAAGKNRHIHSSKQGLVILNRQIEIYNSFNREKICQRVDDLSVGTRFVVEVPEGFEFM